MPIYALSPAGFVTGGPESMHQLVHKARRQGFEAYIHYYGDGEKTVPDAYRHYDVAVAEQLVDSPDAIVIVPETATTLLPKLHLARRVVWWLSVDAFLLQSDSARNFQVTTVERGPLDFVFDPRQRITHATHSEYGRLFLAMKGVKASMLGDYISTKIRERCVSLAGASKTDRVAYNPRKGRAFTEALMHANADRISWVPIHGLTAEGVAELLSTCKLYIDFGEHPGQDHLPKEAAIAGCCILTGTRGAAGNDSDIPIPKQYKLNESAPAALDEVSASITRILADFEAISRDFDAYRGWVLTHETLFERQIKTIFGPGGILAPSKGTPALSRPKAYRR